MFQSLNRNELLAAFPDSIQALLKRHLSLGIVPQGTICFDAGDLVERVYFPTSGLITLLVSAGGNARAEAGVIGSEGAAGLQSAVSSRRSFARAIVQVPGEFWSIPAERLWEAVQRSADAKALVTNHAEVLWAEAQQLAACNAIHPALARLARWLLQAADRTQSDQLPLTQQSLSQMLGIRRTSVTLLAQRLQDRGIIKCNRGSVVILDRAMLESSCCQCYQIIRKLYRRESQNSGVARYALDAAE